MLGYVATMAVGTVLVVQHRSLPFNRAYNRDVSLSFEATTVYSYRGPR